MSCLARFSFAVCCQPLPLLDGWDPLFERELMQHAVTLHASMCLCVLVREECGHLWPIFCGLRQGTALLLATFGLSPPLVVAVCMQWCVCCLLPAVLLR